MRDAVLALLDSTIEESNDGLQEIQSDLAKLPASKLSVEGAAFASILAKEARDIEIWLVVREFIAGCLSDDTEGIDLTKDLQKSKKGGKRAAPKKAIRKRKA